MNHIEKPTYFKLGNILILYSNIQEKIITLSCHMTLLFIKTLIIVRRIAGL